MKHKQHRFHHVFLCFHLVCCLWLFLCKWGYDDIKHFLLIFQEQICSLHMPQSPFCCIPPWSSVGWWEFLLNSLRGHSICNTDQPVSLCRAQGTLPLIPEFSPSCPFHQKPYSSLWLLWRCKSHLVTRHCGTPRLPLWRMYARLIEQKKKTNSTPKKKRGCCDCRDVCSIDCISGLSNKCFWKSISQNYPLEWNSAGCLCGLL